MLGFATLYGTVTAIGAVISSLTKAYDYTAKDNSLFGGIFIVSGILGSIVIGIFLDKYHKYKLTLTVVSLSGIGLMCLVLYTLPHHNVPLFAFNLVLLGFGLIPLSPVALGFSVELTYPTPEAVSNGMLLLPAKVTGSLFAVIASFAASYSPEYAVMIFIGNAAVCFVCSLFIQEDLRRLRPKGLPIQN